MTNLSKIQSRLSDNVLSTKALNALKGGTCLPPPKTGSKTSYSKYACYNISFT